jgi:hypothetical protein
MRLPPPLIDLLGRHVVRHLCQSGLLLSDHPDRTAEKVCKLIAQDLATEDAITDEARLLLAQHQEALKGQDVEYHRLLAKVKGELASKRGYILSTGPTRISREKLLDFSRQILRLVLSDDDLDYTGTEEGLRAAIQQALEREMGRDELRAQKARQKVLNIKRRIPEDSPEYHALFQQFYRELLDKEQ